MRRFILLPLLLLAATGLFAADTEVGTPLRLSDQWVAGDRYMGIRLLGAVALGGDPALAELSDLAWDQDAGILYAVSDRGRLLHLRPEFEDGILTGARLLASHPLLNRKGKRLRKWRRDAEGMVATGAANGIAGDTRLLISFEGRNQVEAHDPVGHDLGPVALPPALTDPALFRHRNKGLEALARHPALGLVSGPELPPEDHRIPLIDQQGRRWFYPTFEPDGALVALEAMPDGGLMVLERAFTPPFSPWVITLSRIAPTPANLGTTLEPRLLARFDGTEGWRVNNFEGMTRHRGNRYFMVSDDGGHPLLQTQLLYFEVMSSE